MNALKYAAKTLDRFGRTHRFYVEGEMQQYRTLTGGFLTLIILPLILPFAIYKFEEMMNYHEYSILTTIE